MATPPDFTAGQVLTAAQMNAVGLWRITGLTASFTGGSAGSVSNGVITVGSNNTVITITNCFNSDFRNYRLIIKTNSNSVSNADIQFQLRTSGGSTSTTGYYGMWIYASYATTGVAAAGNNNAPNFSFFANALGTNGFNASATILSPNEAQRTSVYSNTARGDIAGTYNGYHDVGTAYTSCVLTCGGGNMTGGTIVFYGYNE
jgi:hypothetical protein